MLNEQKVILNEYKYKSSFHSKTLNEQKVVWLYHIDIAFGYIRASEANQVPITGCQLEAKDKFLRLFQRQIKRASIPVANASRQHGVPNKSPHKTPN